MTRHPEVITSLFIQAVQKSVPAGECFRFRARGGSMSPVIRDGDVVHVRRTGPDLTGPGDIVAVENGGGIRVHRLIRKRRGPRGWILGTQGDTLMWEDEPASGGDLLGKVIAVEKAGGKHVRLETNAAVVSNFFFLGISNLKRILNVALNFAGLKRLAGFEAGANSRALRFVYRGLTMLPYQILVGTKGRDAV
ncbi:MAG: S24/S26 family peptidase [bacterium]